MPKTQRRQQKKKPDGSQAVQPNKSQIIRANVNRTVIASQSFVSLYSNDTQIQMTPWDVRLIFGEIERVERGDEVSVTIKQTGDVKMSPQHAKRITLILIKQLTEYEEKYGEIPQPPED